ncbi:MAG: serine hydrolase [Candidatus Omnitrophica bacterium]|nr:serine hydrolase [Candidatus Omnitrophota bacterium]
MKKIIFLITAIFFASLSRLPAEDKVLPLSPDKIKQILADFEQYAQKAIQEWQVPGMAIGIIQGDSLIYAKGFGVKALGGTDPVTTKTIFQIGSTTKAFTTTIAGMLVDENKFKWDDGVVGMLPDFMKYDPWVTREFEVVDLMSQHSGMPGYAGDSLAILGYNRDNIRHAIRYIKPVTSFRSQYAYVNNLFLVASALIEKKSGVSWEENVRERIFKPLGMNNSSVDMQSFLQAKDVASLHVKKNGKVMALPKEWEYLDWSYTYGPAGAINSNIEDMAKWVSFQINNGKVKDKQLISEKNLEFLRSPKTIIKTSPPGENIYYCMGWLYAESKPYPVIWHNGGTSGMKTMVAFVPQANIGIVILSNLITGLPEVLAFKFFEQYFDKPPKVSVSEALAEADKLEKEAEAKKPAHPKSSCAPMALDKYTGDYANDIYGKINISVVDSKLVLTIGPKNVKMPFAPWDKDVFMVSWPVCGLDDDSGFAIFEVSPEGEVTGVNLDFLDTCESCGVFKKIAPKASL